MPYDKHKRNKVDKCNICTLLKPLSWDHVPPKGGIKLSAVEIKNIFDVLSGKTDNSFRISQNGVKYRTICSSCNSEIGNKFDPTLNEFNFTIANYIQSNLILPSIIYIKTKPNRLIKAILAHLVAAKLNYDKVQRDELIRNLIFVENIEIPENINIFYWIYPYDTTIIMRDFSIPVTPGDFSNFALCDVIKYFPIAFLISDTLKFRGLDNLTRFKSYDLDEEIEIPLNLKRIEDYNWPERVDDSNILFLTAESQNGVLAKPK